jgi:hypothetical protein
MGGYKAAVSTLPVSRPASYTTKEGEFMKKALLIAVTLVLGACANQFSIPSDINGNAKVEVAPVTGEVIVRHLIQIELPTVLSDDCKRKFPNDVEAYNACVSEYIKYLISIINQVPPVGL